MNIRPKSCMMNQIKGVQNKNKNVRELNQETK